MWYSEPRSDYQLVVTQECFCQGGTTHVRVRDGVVVRATQNSHPVALPTTIPLSIDDLFLLIYRGESQGWDMDITYDETWGYPPTSSGTRADRTVDSTSVWTRSRRIHPARHHEQARYAARRRAGFTIYQNQQVAITDVRATGVA